MADYDVLLLNANYEPLNVCNIRRAVSLIMVGKAEVIQGSEDRYRTSEATWDAPSVVRMRYHVRRPMPQLRLSRHSILARDCHTCQYCGSTRDLTIDHVRPRWSGGGNTWDNLVTCCRKCNLKKGDKTPEQAKMKLARSPKRPQYVPYLSLQKYIRAVKRDDWMLYLPVFNEFVEEYAKN